jgi:hypothetical protein
MNDDYTCGYLASRHHRWHPTGAQHATNEHPLLLVVADVCALLLQLLRAAASWLLTAPDPDVAVAAASSAGGASVSGGGGGFEPRPRRGPLVLDFGGLPGRRARGGQGGGGSGGAPATDSLLHRKGRGGHHKHRWVEGSGVDAGAVQQVCGWDTVGSRRGRGRVGGSAKGLVGQQWLYLL